MYKIDNDNRKPLGDIENRPAPSWILRIASAIVIIQIGLVGWYVYEQNRAYHDPFQTLTLDGRTFGEDLLYHINKELTK